jgi:hypothetical protein
LRFSVRRLEIITLAIFAGLSFVSARPLLEEWGVTLAFKVHGVAFMQHLRATPLRPLQYLPDDFLAALGGGRTYGFILGFFLLLACQYVVARWAITPLATDTRRWVFAVCAATLPVWPAAWLARYSAVHLNVIFLLLAFGALIRCRPKLRVRWTVLAAVATALTLATYEAVVICLLLLPVVVIMCGSTERPSLRRAAALALPILGGVALYGVYAVVAVHVAGTTGYETAGVQSRQWQTLSAAIGSLVALFKTSYLESPTALAIFFALFASVAGPAIVAMQTKAARIRWIGGFGATLVLLPLLALPYIVNIGWSADPERVLLPVSLGFVLLIAIAVTRFETPSMTTRTGAGAVVATVLALAVPLAISAYGFSETERLVIRNTASIAAAHHASRVVVRDYTGTLGDVYTLYGVPTKGGVSVFDNALKVEGAHLDAALCSPDGVDRDLPYARRLLIFPTIPRCEALPPAFAHPDLVIDVDPTYPDWSFPSEPGR